MSKKLILIIGIVAVVVILFVAASSFTNAPVSNPNATETVSSTAETTTKALVPPVSLPKQTSHNTPGVATPPKQNQPTTSNKVIAPLSGDQWVLGDSYQIQWTEKSLGSGTVVLLDAQTRSLVGYITPSLTLNQKAVSWNAKDVLISPTSGQKKNIGPGLYLVRITFDVGHKPAIESGAFSVIYPNQKTVDSQTFVIQGYVMSPSKLTVKRGDVIYITNNDASSYRLLMSGFPSITVPGNQTTKFETTILSSGYYELYSDQYTGLKGGITVQ